MGWGKISRQWTSGTSTLPSLGNTQTGVVSDLERGDASSDPAQFSESPDLAVIYVPLLVHTVRRMMQ